MKTTKRFIAGAICPRCSQLDKIVMFAKGEVQYRECVDCGFKDEIRIQPTHRELTTRVNQTPESEDKDISPVKILDPDKGME